MANKRIRDLSERTTFSSGDYLATDNSNGTRKVNASKILTPISTAQSTADLVTSRVSNSGDAFSSSKGYDVGALVVAPDDNLIYRCKTAYSTGASWNSRKANFEQYSVVKAVDTLNAALSDKQDKLNHTQVSITVSANSSVAPFSYFGSAQAPTAEIASIVVRVGGSLQIALVNYNPNGTIYLYTKSSGTYVIDVYYVD